MKKLLKAITCEIKDLNDDDRSFTAVASDEGIDRDGDRIMAAGWDVTNFLKNPVIPWAHNYSQPPVARATEISVESGRLMFKPKFPSAEEYPFADTIWKLYKGGYLKAFSVGFQPKRWELVDRGNGLRGRDYLEQELWEISACTVPSNPNALVAAKSAGVITEEEAASLGSAESENRGRGESEKGNNIDTRLSAIEASLTFIGEAVAVLSHDLAPREPQPGDKAESKETGNPERGTLNPEPLTPEAVRTALDAAVAALDTRIKSMVAGEIKYHLGIVD